MTSSITPVNRFIAARMRCARAECVAVDANQRAPAATKARAHRQRQPVAFADDERSEAVEHATEAIT